MPRVNTEPISQRQEREEHLAPIHDALHAVVYKSGSGSGLLHSKLDNPRVAASADRVAFKRPTALTF